jgi:hypothetical protein
LKKVGFRYLKTRLSKQICVTSVFIGIILPLTFLLDGRKLQTIDAVVRRCNIRALRMIYLGAKESVIRKAGP